MTNMSAEGIAEGKYLATVLLIEIDGFASLSEKLDTHTMMKLVQETWKRLDKVIVDHGGKIISHVGDEVLAVWGIPSPNPDDAEQAVNCSLEIQSHLASFRVDRRLSIVGQLKIKAGIASGNLLLAGVGASNLPSAFGEAVNDARRFAELVAPDKILIDQQTFHQVHGVFRVYRVSDLFVRGKSEPISGFYVEARHDQPTRIRYTGTAGLETRMVGREQEFKSLVDLFEPLDFAVDPFLTLVIGEPGLGKSRLLYEFSGEVESSPKNYNFMSVRSVAQAHWTPFFLWKTLWRHRFGIRDGMSEEESREALLRGVLKAWGKRLGRYSAIEAAHFIGELIGLSWKNSPYLVKYEGKPVERNRRAFELIREMFVRMADSGPIILMIDDLQWLDVGSMELLLYLLRQGADSLQMLVIASALPKYLESYPEWASLAYKTIELKPIEYNFKMVASAYPSLGIVPDALLARMIERSGGIPLYLEEIVKHIHFDRMKRGDEVSPKISVAYPIPDSLRGLLLSRLDQVSQQAREVLQLASVGGRIFWRGGILAAAKQPVGTGLLNLPMEVLEGVVDEALNEIVRAELAFPRSDVGYFGEKEYIFKHRELQQVAYELLPEKYRKFYHFAVAKWLAEKTDTDAQVMIARHFEKAGNISSALRYYQFAYEHAMADGITAEAELLEDHIKRIRSGEKAKKQGA